MTLCRSIKNLIFVFAFVFLAAMFVSCNPGGTDSPDYVDPAKDESPFQPAPEFEYLVDLNAGLDLVKSTLEGATAGDEPISTTNIEEIVSVLGFKNLEDRVIKAEANSSMVHANALYEIEQGMNVLSTIAGSAPAEVKFPAMIDSSRYVGSVFIANPGTIIKNAFSALDQAMKAEMGEPDPNQPMMFNPDINFFANMFGFSKAEDIYSWMGEEMGVLTFTNPNFNPEGDVSAENTAFYSVMICSSTTPKSGLDTIETLATAMNNLMSMSAMYMGGGTEMQDPKSGITRETVDGKDTLTISMRDRIAALMPEDTEGTDQYINQMPNMMATVSGNYLFYGDEYSVKALVAAFKPDGGTTGRTATIEFESNWDKFGQSFLPQTASLLPSLILTQDLDPDVTELLQKISDRFRQAGPVGTSRMSMKMNESGSLECDLLTSRESVKLYEDMKALVEETPEETWKKLGEAIGKMSGEAGFENNPLFQMFGL